MYEKKESGARGIILAICAIAAIGAIAVGVKIVLDRVNGNPVTSAKEACDNKDGMNTLNDAGVFGESGNNCETESE